MADPTPVSVVVTLFNKAGFIARALRSVLEQTVGPLEIIVVDDGSTDGGGEIVQKMGDSRIRLVRQENRGVNTARNRGVAEARGNLVAFLDADDAWRPRFLEVIRSLAEKFPQAGIYGTARTAYRSYGVLEDYSSPILPSGQKEGLVANYLEAAPYFPFHISGVAVPKQVLETIGGFPDGEHLAGDVDTILRIALRYPMAWSAEPLLIYYRDDPDRLCGPKRRPMWTEPRISRTAREALASGRLSPEQARQLKEYVAIIQLNAAMDCLRTGEREVAERLIGYAQDTRRYRRLKGKLALLKLLSALPRPFWAGYEKIKAMERVLRLKLEIFFRWWRPPP